MDSRGGVQAGTSTISSKSGTLEAVLRDYINFSDLKNKYDWKSGLSAKELQKYIGCDDTIRLTGIYPDGGIIMNPDKNDKQHPVLCMFECKKQGKTGNAIERWAKNFRIAEFLGCKRYVTFCRGEGFRNNNSAERFINTMKFLVDSDAQTTWNDDNGMLGFYRFDSDTVMRKSIANIVNHEIMLAMKANETTITEGTIK